MPDGDIVVVGEKVIKMSKHKAVLLVRFISPPSYGGHKIQLYPKSLEPSRGQGQGADLSLLSALQVSHPKATTLRHLGSQSTALPNPPLLSSWHSLHIPPQILILSLFIGT